jgi:hypothetical protein
MKQQNQNESQERKHRLTQRIPRKSSDVSKDLHDSSPEGSPTRRTRRRPSLTKRFGSSISQTMNFATLLRSGEQGRTKSFSLSSPTKNESFEAELEGPVNMDESPPFSRFKDSFALFVVRCRRMLTDLCVGTRRFFESA